MAPLQPPPSDDPRLAPLIAYLEEHRQQINVEALRKQLREAGHPPELVDEAVRRVMGAGASPDPAWPIGLLVSVVNLVVLPSLFGGITTALVGLFPGLNDSLLWLPLPLLAVAAIPVAELIVGRRMRDGPRDRLGRGLAWGGVFTLAAMGVLGLLFGACVVVIFSML